MRVPGGMAFTSAATMAAGEQDVTMYPYRTVSGDVDWRRIVEDAFRKDPADWTAYEIYGMGRMRAEIDLYDGVVRAPSTDAGKRLLVREYVRREFARHRYARALRGW